MSTSAYSLDLRARVVDFVKAGHSQREAAKLFSISKTTVNTWWVRYKIEGHFLPKKRPGSKPKIDLAEFINYVENEHNATASDIGKRFNMTYSGATYWLRKLGFSYKKKNLPTWKQMSKKEMNI